MNVGWGTFQGIHKPSRRESRVVVDVFGLQGSEGFQHLVTLAGPTFTVQEQAGVKVLHDAHYGVPDVIQLGFQQL